MNITRTFFAIAILTIVGLYIVLQGVNHRELNTQISDLEREGHHLINYLALHSLEDFKGDRRDYLLKTLIERPLLTRMAYLLILDQNDNAIVNLTPNGSEMYSENKIFNSSTPRMDNIAQPYTPHSDPNLLEFAKPIYMDGLLVGTIRLGLLQPQRPGLTMAKISLLATIVFYILASVIIAFFGFAGVLKSLTRLRNIFISSKVAPPPSTPRLFTQNDITQSLNEIQSTWLDARDRFDEMRAVNQQLTTRISVLLYENQQTNAILDHINLGILVTDTQNIIIHINAYLLNLFCLTREACIDKSAQQTLDHPDIIDFHQYIHSSDTSKPPLSIEVQFPELAPGENFLLSHAMIGQNKHPVGKIYMLKTITLEKNLEQTTKDFTAHLSHELLTPLTTIQSYSEMLADDEVSGVEMRNEFINTINEETNRLARLIKDILNYSKIEGGTLTLDKGLVRSDWLFEDSLAAVEGAALKKSITIEKILPDNFPSLIGDKDQLKGCIINVLGNAVKYTAENGTIQFELREADEMVVFDIKDNGCGISEKEIPLIFNKFFRSDQPAVTTQQGTGLGLAIAYEVVSLHNGSIEVHSSMGEGSLFSIKIPKEEYYLGKETQSTSRRRRIPHQESH